MISRASARLEEEPMPRVEESIPADLAEEAEAARAWFVRNQGSAFKLTGIVDPEEVGERDPQTQTRQLQLILCGSRDSQDVCLRERFDVTPASEGFDVTLVEDSTPEVGSPAPLLDPPAGVRAGWLAQVRAQHAFVVLVFYRGFW
jgi:hypothetical protein